MTPQLLASSALRRAVVNAVLAPSVHNTQPWRFVLDGAALEVHADWSRRLPVLDRRGRQLLLSCGCALLNARVTVAAAGLTPRVESFPDPARPGLLARLTALHPVAGAEQSLARLEPGLTSRRTTRATVDDATVPDEVITALVAAARAEGVELLPLRRPQDQRTAARLWRRADQVSDATPGYRQELSAWTGGDAGGVPTRTAPEGQCLLLLGSRHDSQAEWLRAGEALGRVLLEITLRGYAASTVMQVVEVSETNDRLRSELELSMHPQVLLRVGRAAAAPATRRRRLVDVLTEAP